MKIQNTSLVQTFLNKILKHSVLVETKYLPTKARLDRKKLDPTHDMTTVVPVHKILKEWNKLVTKYRNKYEC